MRRSDPSAQKGKIQDATRGAASLGKGFSA
jgi:hypothetical protein